MNSCPKAPCQILKHGPKDRVSEMGCVAITGNHCDPIFHPNCTTFRNPPGDPVDHRGLWSGGLTAQTFVDITARGHHELPNAS